MDDKTDQCWKQGNVSFLFKDSLSLSYFFPPSSDFFTPGVFLTSVFFTSAFFAAGFISGLASREMPLSLANSSSLALSRACNTSRPMEELMVTRHQSALAHQQVGDVHFRASRGLTCADSNLLSFLSPPLPGMQPGTEASQGFPLTASPSGSNAAGTILPIIVNTARKWTQKNVSLC